MKSFRLVSAFLLFHAIFCLSLHAQYSYHRAIVIDHTKVPNTDQTNFPILVSGTYSYLATVANGGKVQNSNGYDIIFTSDLAGTSQLDHEIDSYDPTTGTVNFWVRIPTLSHTSDTVIYMWYGNSAITTSQENEPGVWDSYYKGVWHFSNPTSLSAVDSTDNGNDGTVNGTPSVISGQIGSAADFAGSGDDIAIQTISLSGVNYTISAWFNTPLSTTTGGWNTLTRGASRDHQIIVYEGNWHLGTYNSYNAIFEDSGFDVSTLASGWHHVVAAGMGSSTIVYVDGVQVGTIPYKSNEEISYLGNYQGGGQQFGDVDELRISTGIARSSDWIASEYNNQKSPSTFYSVGSENGVDVWIQPPVTTSVVSGQSYQVAAIVTGTTNAAVTWSISPANGSVNSSGVYTAGSTQQAVSVIATSVADGTKSASATADVLSYGYHRAIVIDHTKVPNSDQSNFPILVSGAYSYLATVANGGKVQSSSGYDIIFTSDLAGTTQLDHEIESYDPATGTVSFWVRIPTLSHSSDTVIYMQYGNSSITISQEHKTGVWDSNYLFVQHLGANSNDSTGNNNGTDTSGMVHNTANGFIAGGAGFGGSDWISEGTSSKLSPANITFTAWVKPSSLNTYTAVESMDNSGSSYDHTLLIKSSGKLAAYLNGGPNYDGTGTNTLSLGSWYYVGFTFDGGTLKGYVNGSVDGTASGTGYTNSVAATDYIGNSSYSGRTFSGSIDEVRISKTARTADWMATEYNNQSSPSTFYSIGDENAVNVWMPNPTTVQLIAGQSHQFAAMVTGSANQSVTWSISPSNGSISGTGLYTAGNTQQAVTITATSVADATKSASDVANVMVYSYSRALTIDHTKIPNTDQTNFPVLVSGTYSYLATVANGGKVQNSSGYDIVFSDGVGTPGTSKLDHEIESYDPTTGAINAWVRVPMLSHTADTTIYIQYGDSSITSSQENKAGVWDSSYVGVWHMPNGTTLSAVDSTQNGNSGTDNGATATTGVIDGAASFNGSSYISLPSMGTTSKDTKLTLSAWVNPTSTSGQQAALTTTTVTGSFAAIIGTNGSNLTAETGEGAIGGEYANDTSAFSTGQWYYLTGTFDEYDVNLYVNGVKKATTAYNSASSSSPNPYGWNIGAYFQNGGGYLGWNGSLDEVRLSDELRSADWIATEYNNQSSPSTFYSLGGENVVGISVVPAAVSLYGSQTQQFTAVVTNTANTAATWAISGSGSINSSSGLYTAPSTISSTSTVTVTGTSSADVTKSATATVTLYPPLTVSVSPGTSTLSLGQTQQFTATVTNASNTNVVWSISPQVGTISPSGLYTPPATIGTEQSITVTATSVVDNTTAATSTITLTPASNVYGYRRLITIDHTKVPNTDQINFPVLVSGTYSYLATVANGGEVQSASGYDIIFTSDALGTVKLDHEIESYNPTTGAISFWVRIPEVSYLFDTEFDIQYGNSAISASEENKTGVWDSNYQMVLHLGESGSPYKDSTRNQYSSTGGTYPTQTTGMIGNGQSFNGTSQYIAYSQAQSPNPDAQVTMEAWIQTTDSGTKGIFGKWESDGTGDADQAYQLYYNGGYPHGDFKSTNYPPYPQDISGNIIIDDGSWHHIVATGMGYNMRVFTDGVFAGSGGYGYNLLNTSADRLLVGATTLAAGSYYMSGVLDEVRISNIMRSPDWVVTEYNSESSPSTFYAIGTQVSGLYISPTTVTLYQGQTQQFSGAGVTWSISGAGSINSSTGLYTAPSSISSMSTVTVTATRGSNTVTATITLEPPITVSVSPSSPTLTLGQSQQFTATVTNTANTDVAWTLAPYLGTIDNTGLYTAPITIGGPQTVTVTATSVVDPTRSGSATITLLPAVGVYGYRRAFTIDHTKVSGSDQANFPVLVSGTYSYLATVANGGNVQSSSGYDIIFTSDELGTNRLDHEIENYNPITGAVNFWVRIPALSHTTDTVIYMQYGNSGVTASQENKTGVWDSNYQMVLHLGEPSAPYNDSTINGYASTGGSAPTQVTGEIGNGQSFNGSSQYISYSQTQSPSPTGSATLETWIKTSSTAVNGILGKWNNNGGSYADESYQLWLDGSGYPYGEFSSTDGNYVNTAGSTVVNDGNWHHLVSTAAAPTGTIYIYLDGSQIGSQSNSHPLLATTADMFTVGGSSLAGGYYMGGSLDEVRISNSVRSADWIATEYNNQSSPSTFYALGSNNPVIGYLSTLSGEPGASITISGHDLGSSAGSVTFNGTSATVTGWSDSTVVVTVPSGASSGNVVVTTSGSVTTNSLPFTVLVPTISYISPTGGTSGTTVTITGVNFGSSSGSVTFGGMSATVTTWLDNSIVVTAPSSSSSNVVVTNGGLSSNGVGFNAPTLSALSPNAGLPGSSITLTGTGFGSSGTVTFGGVTATTTGWTSTSITATVPTGALSGNVVVTVGGVASDGVNFSVQQTVVTGTVSYSYDQLGRLVGMTAASGDAAKYSYDAVGNILSVTRYSSSQVTIQSVSPGSGPIGTTVIITGSNFSSTPSSNTVTFNGTAATVSAATTTSLQVTVPSGATTGSLVVTSPTGTATSTFTVTSSSVATIISSFTPGVVNSGSSVTISGGGFSTAAANDRVMVNTYGPLNPSSPTATSMSITAPATGSGHISALTPNGLATSSGDLYIPPSGYTASQVQYNQRTTIGSTATVSISTAGIGMLLFDGKAGHGVSISSASSSFSSCSFQIYTPGGSAMGSSASCSTSSLLAAQILPSSGSYTVLVVPGSGVTGSVQLTISDTSDTWGIITPGGEAVTFATTIAGSNGHFTFGASIGQSATMQLSSSTFSSVTVTLLNPDGSTAVSSSSSSRNFSLATTILAQNGQYTIKVAPSGASGSIQIRLSLSTGSAIPIRKSGAALNTSSPLATNLVGLFVMNEAAGTTDLNLVDNVAANFAGSALPTWLVGVPDIQFGGGSSLNSYLDAGPDTSFDQLTNQQMTIVAKVRVNSTASNQGIAEKNDNNFNSGFVYGIDSTGALRLTVEESAGNMQVGSAASIVPTNLWVQLAFTWDGTVGTSSSAHLYLNGIEQSKSLAIDGAGSIDYAAAIGQSFRIGNADFDFPGSFNGSIVYLAVYKGRILTPTEMGQLDVALPIQ